MFRIIYLTFLIWSVSPEVLTRQTKSSTEARYQAAATPEANRISAEALEVNRRVIVGVEGVVKDVRIVGERERKQSEVLK